MSATCQSSPVVFVPSETFAALSSQPEIHNQSPKDSSAMSSGQAVALSEDFQGMIMFRHPLNVNDKLHNYGFFSPFVALF